MRHSVGTGGSEPNGSSTEGSLTYNGHTLAFNSYASNLVSGDTNGSSDVYTTAVSPDVLAPLQQSEFFGPNDSVRWQCPCQSGSTARSVNTWSGNEHMPLPGIDAGGRGPGLRFELAYNSGNAGVAGSFGYGWSSTYDMSLVSNPDGSRIVKQETGATVTFFPDGAGGWVAPSRNITTLSLAGGVWTFTRNHFGIFRFNSSGQLIGLADRNGYDVTVEHDIAGKVDYVEHEDGRRLDFSYSGNTTTITDPLTPTARTITATLNGAGELSAYTDVNSGAYAMTYSSDPSLSHKLVRVRRPRHANAASPQPALEYEYDTQGRVKWEKDELGRPTIITYNSPVPGATLVTTSDLDRRVDYYTNDLLTSVTSGYGTADAVTVSHTYDPLTLAPLTKTIDPGGLNLTLTYEYDSRGNRTKTTDPDGDFTSATYNGFDQPLTLTDANGVVTTNTYDANGNLELTQTVSTDPAGTRTINPGYDPARPGDVTSLTDERGKAWTYEYDTYGFVKTVRSPSPDLDTTTMVNNTIGWVTSTIAPKGNAVGGVPADFTTTFTYNGYGLVKNTDGPAGLVQRGYYLGGLLKTVTDQSTQITTYAYSDADELITVTRPDTSVVRTEYGPDGAMSAQVDAAGARTEYTYDPADRLKTVKDPLSLVTTFGYDAAGRLQSKQLPGGNCATPDACIKYEYFADGQLKKIDYSDSTPDVTYTYEPTGRPLTMSDGAAVPGQWDWDDLGRLKSYTDVTGAISYGYEGLSGLINQITYPGNKVVNRTFDNAGQMMGVTDWASRATAFDFDPNGNLDLTTFPSATTNVDDYVYDNADRMAGVSFNKAGSPLAQLTFERTHAEGFVSATSGTGVPNATENYGYSSLDQLNGLNGNTISYDTADNLAGFAAGPKQRFDAANQICYQATTNTPLCGEPAPADATTFEYDNRGNRISTTAPGQAARTMTYDLADRMTSSTATENAGELTVMDSAVLFDTRPYSRTSNCSPTPPGPACTTFTAGEVKQVQVTGQAGIPSSGVGAVVLKVTSILGSTAGWVRINRVYPSTAAAGMIRIDPGEANNVTIIAKVDSQGRISVEADQIVDVVITVSGWYATSDGSSGSTFTAITPERIVDTRPPPLNQGTCSGGCVRLTAGQIKTMTVTGGNVPAAPNVSAVFVNVLATGPAGTGVVRVNQNPFNGTMADATINIDGTSSNSGTAIANVSSDGTISIYSSVDTDIAIDISGWFGATGEATFVSVPPARVMDTRSWAPPYGDCLPSSCATIPTNGQSQVKVKGWGGLPTSSITAVVLSVTATSTGTGQLRVNWDGGSNSAAILNGYGTGEHDSALVIVKPDINGRINLNALSAPFDVFIDAVGYFMIPQTTSYTYSGDGLRRTKTSPDGTITTYTWDHSQAVPLLLKEAIEAPGTTNDKSIRYIYGPDGRPIEDITTIGYFDSEPRFYHHDQLGSTRMLTGMTGTTIGTAGYTPHGQTATTTGDTTNLGWASEYRDDETGNIYLRARYYDPTTAQFLTRDPIEAITRSPYAYVQNNPINMVDPTGLDAKAERICGKNMSYSRSNGCQPNGANTPMVLEGPGSGLDAEDQAGCDDPSHNHGGVNPADPETYNPTLKRVDPYGPFIGLGQVFKAVVDVVVAIVSCVESGSVWGAQGAAGGAYVGTYVGHPGGGALVGGVSGAAAGCAVGLVDPNPPGFVR